MHNVHDLRSRRRFNAPANGDVATTALSFSLQRARSHAPLLLPTLWDFTNLPCHCPIAHRCCYLPARRPAARVRASVQQADGEPYVRAAKRADQLMLDCLKRVGCPLPAEALTGALAWGVPLPILRWLVDQVS